MEITWELGVEVIAEAGVSHRGSMYMAQALADTAHAAGADAFKIQTFDPYRLYKKPPDDLVNAVLSHKDTKHLAKHCEGLDIEFMSTPGDLDSLKFLIDECGVKRIKIGSDDLTYKPLVEAAYRSGKPVILSTGMATLQEIKDALPHDGGFAPITLLHCMSLYPTPTKQANLRYIKYLNDLGYPVGYSDHTQTHVASFMAMAMGACLLEKHICPSEYKGPDAEISMIPLEFRLFMGNLREYQHMLGQPHWPAVALEKRPDRVNVKAFRKGPDGYRDGPTDGI